MNSPSFLRPPRRLRCEALDTPLGLEARQPRLSWQLAPRPGASDSGQSAFQVRVADSANSLQTGRAIRWDSGRVESAQNLHVPYGGPALASRQRLWWTVRVWDAAGQPSAWARPTWFETGLLDPADWQAAWIQADESADAPCFRCEFTLAEAPVAARAYVCGLGYSELTLDGQRIGDHVLDPNWTNYDRRDFRDLLYPFDDQSRKRALYIAYDVTAALRAPASPGSRPAGGRHAVGVWLGNGMHNQRGRTIEGKMGYGPPRLRLQLEMTFADGRRRVVASDDSWRWSPSPIVFNNVFLGEVYDARLEQPGWNLPGFDDRHWSAVRPAPAPVGELHAQLSPPDKVVGTVPPVAMREADPGVWVYDFGRNFAGWVRLRLPGHADMKAARADARAPCEPSGAPAIQLRFAEETDAAGRLDFASAGGEEQIQRDRYILGDFRDAARTYAPRFTWHCFRYAELSGFPGTPGLDTLSGEEVHAAAARRGTFRCSTRLLRQINETFVRTQLANMHGGVPSDCPHRERLGYTGDGQLAAEAALWNLDAGAFYAKWSDDIHDAQNRQTGFVPHTAPFYGGGGGPAWGSAIVIVPWQHYRFYGDDRILAEHYDGMRLWLDYLGRCTDSRGIVVREEPGSWFLGDWSLPVKLTRIEDMPLSPTLVNTAYCGFCAERMARIAGVLGRDADRRDYVARLASVRAAFHAAFFDSARSCYGGGTHGADAIALALGAVPPPHGQAVLDHLVRSIAANGGHLDTGIVATPLLLDVLSDFGRADVAYRIMTRTTFPSFGYMLARGATTLWENWYEECGSHCHPMYGSVCAWLYRVVAGLRLDPEVPAFRRVRIVPPNLPGLRSAGATVDTPHGRLDVAWSRRRDRLEIRLRVPPGCTAQVCLDAYPNAEPGAVPADAGAGGHRLAVPLAHAARG